MAPGSRAPARSVIDGEASRFSRSGPTKIIQGFQGNQQTRITREGKQQELSSASPATANSDLGQPWAAHREAPC